MICLYVGFVVVVSFFIYLSGVLWTSQICGLLSDINLGEILSHCFKYSIFFFLFLIVFPLHMLYIFFTQVLESLDILSFPLPPPRPRQSLFCFSVLEVSTDTSSNSESFLSCVYCTNELIKGILSVTMYFNLEHFFCFCLLFFFFRIFIFLLTLPICSCILSTLFVRSIIILIIVVLNSCHVWFFSCSVSANNYLPSDMLCNFFWIAQRGVLDKRINRNLVMR